MSAIPYQLPESFGLLIETAVFGSFVAFGLLGGAYLLREAWLACEASTWLKTEGQILSSGTQVARLSLSKVRTYEPKIRYEYCVNGRLFRSNRFRFAGLSCGLSAAQQIAKNYPIGKIVAVHYHPRRNGEAFLEPLDRGAVLDMVFGASVCLLFAGFGAAMLWSV